MTIRVRTEICFVLAAIAIVGPWLYYDLELGIKLLEPRQLQIVWGLSIAMVIAIIAFTGGTKGNLIGSVMCMTVAPVIIFMLILLLVWCVLSPAKIEKIKPENEIGANVI